MQKQEIAIKLNLNKVHGKAATREITKVARAINATIGYGFTIDDWNNKIILDRQTHDQIGSIDIT
jgi:hypothetical protein